MVAVAVDDTARIRSWYNVLFSLFSNAQSLTVELIVQVDRLIQMRNTNRLLSKLSDFHTDKNWEEYNGVYF